MPFSDELPKKTYDETRNRPTTDYARFDQRYRLVARVLDTHAKTVWKHWIQQANEGRGLSANCPNVRADMSVCPLEQSVRSLPRDSQERKDRVARRRFIINVLDRTPYTVCTSCNTEIPQTKNRECISCGADNSKSTFKPLNKVKIVEGGVKLFNQTLNPIEQMQYDDYKKENGEGVDITDYDIIFTTNGVNRDKQIAAFPQPPSELKEEDFLDPTTGEKQALYDLDLLAEPSTIEEINLMLGGASLRDVLAVREGVAVG